MLWTVILELEVLAQHLDLVMAGKDDHIVAVLYHRDLAKHPNVPIRSEDSQDQCTQFFSDFAGLEAMKHQVTQNLDWQLQTMRYPEALKANFVVKATFFWPGPPLP